MTPYLSSEMVTALFGPSDHCLPFPGLQGNSTQNSTQLTLSTVSFLSAGFDGQSCLVSAVSLLAPEKYICRLRLDLIEMLRISLHAVDYATKAYAFGRMEFALSATRGRKKLEHLAQTITATVQELSKTEEIDDPQLAFRESARAISAALSSICQLAYEICSHIVALLQDGLHQRSNELVQLGEHIACSLRLCIVTFVKQKAECAEAVLQGIDEWRRGSTERSWRAKYTAPAMLPSEWSIAAGLKRMMDDLHSIAMGVILDVPLSVPKTPSGANLRPPTT